MKNEVQLLNFFVAGLVYADLAFAQKNARAGCKVSLLREPTNPHDPNAILVMLKGKKIGYVPRDLTRAFRDFPGREISRAAVHSYAATNPTERMVLIAVYAVESRFLAPNLIC